MSSTILHAASPLADAVAELLREARARTLLLIAPLSDDELRAQHDPLLSPLVWDMGHIAGFEELWLTRNLDGPIEFVEMPGLYNPFEHPRRERGALVLPGRAEVIAHLAAVRAKVLERLATTDFDSGSPLLRDGYVYRMVAQHEAQHNETMLQTMQLMQGRGYRPAERRDPPVARDQALALAGVRGAMVRVPGGTYAIGTHDRSAAYDNERPRHAVTLAPYRIDITPVTNGQYLRFIADGGYSRPELWSEAGRAWLAESRVDAPMYWELTEGVWSTRMMDRRGPVDPAHPVSHVTYYEADAFARWAGKRLPTEAEWEVAATWDPATGAPRAYPWGEDAPTERIGNIDQLTFGTTPVGTYPRNVSPFGCYGMIGDVWEWTSSDFGPYPGYETFPYAEYSEVFFGSEYKVLRGGSWATRAGVARTTFRNWDYPIRRQIFSGFRCAADV
ncbi:MAG TPA: ergothioneine biosynthesis protein EgtB [Gemmatimonadaceae bacterium]|nr:ergothioneine biosynthesis protein EgtB [Gemmatimonadaceae bacterium]